jgi:hypothetical protein
MWKIALGQGFCMELAAYDSDPEFPGFSVDITPDIHSSVRVRKTGPHAISFMFHMIDMGLRNRSG